MIRYTFTFVVAFLFYLLLTIGAWSKPEIIAAVFVGLAVSLVAAKFHFRDALFHRNPLRLLLFCIYIFGPFLLEVTKANVEVAWRVITGRIRPGIVRYQSGLKSDGGLMLLANSITLTPGTLSVDVDEQTRDIFVHVLNIPSGMEEQDVWSGKSVFSMFDLSRWVRRIAE